MAKDEKPAHASPAHETHSAEEALIATREAKASRVRERGENPFANVMTPLDAAARTIDLSALRTLANAAKDEAGKYDEAKTKAAADGQMFHVRGRVVALRGTGGLTFVRLRDRTGEIQLLASEAEMGAEYARFEDIDIGDFVQAEGVLIASKRGELSLETRTLRLLTKALRPLPEKWHGLTDVETRYRQRYVDLVANPTVGEVFRARSHIVRAVRRVMDDTGFLEVETPTMHPLIGGAAAKPFITHHNALDMQLYMRIAPELYLKRLVVGGLERVYEIGRCYRNEGISTRHNPEFTMLEFYQAYATYEDLMNFTEVLLRAIDTQLAAALPEAHARWAKDRPFTFDEPFARVPMAKAVEDAAKKSQIAAWADLPAKALIALLAKEDFGGNMKEWSKSSPRAKAIDWGNFRKGFSKCENDGERLFALYEYLSEPFLIEDYRSQRETGGNGSRSLPVFIIDYPYETSPLARKNDKDPTLVDRFELFVHGRELCNAFSELNDPRDQAERFAAQVAKKAAGADETMDYDADYIRALEHGMPPAAGFGMGIDRLVMMLTSQPSIRDVVFFPQLRAAPEHDVTGDVTGVVTSGTPIVVVSLVISAAFSATALRALMRRRSPDTFEPKTESSRALRHALAALMGIIFAVSVYFATASHGHPHLKYTVKETVVVQGIAVGSGVLFTLALLTAALPFLLDRLEGRTFSSFVAARHVRSQKSGFLTVISILSICGVAVSSCALSSVVSVMGGFRQDLKRKILGNNAHIVVDTVSQSTWSDEDPVLARLRAIQGVLAATPVVHGEVMVWSASNLAGVVVRGVDPTTINNVVDLGKNIEVGKFEYLVDPSKLGAIGPDEVIGIGPGGEQYTRGVDLSAPEDLDPKKPSAGNGGSDPNEIDPLIRTLPRLDPVKPGLIIGRELAKTLHVYVGDDVTLVSPLGDLGPMGVMPRTKKFKVAAIFYSGMYEYDATQVYTLLDVAQEFFGLGDKISAIDVKVDDAEQADRLTATVQSAVERPDLRTRDWREMNKNLFSALKLEHFAAFIVLSIAILVASFCIICTLLLMVTEKGKEIAILKAIGATDGAIRRTFTIEGLVIGAIGTIFGMATSLALCTGLSWFGLRLDPEVYYIDQLPISVNGWDFFAVGIAALSICTLSTVYPARAASRLRPVDGLRYE